MICQSFRALQPQTSIKTHQKKVSALIIGHFWNFCDTQGNQRVSAKIAAGSEAAAGCCKMFQSIFVFKSSQGDVDIVAMEHQGPIITAINR